MTEAEPAREDQGRGSAFFRKAGEWYFKWMHGYSVQEARQSEYWRQMTTQMLIDGTLQDDDWIRARQSELQAQAGDTRILGQAYIQAYGRAHLEDYCRHQARLDDGRAVIRLPVYGVGRDRLLAMGMEVDTFSRTNVHESSGYNYTAILPQGWSFGPEYRGGADQGLIDPLSNTRWAFVFDQGAEPVLEVFYSNKPFGFEDSFKSRTQLPFGHDEALEATG